VSCEFADERLRELQARTYQEDGELAAFVDWIRRACLCEHCTRRRQEHRSFATCRPGSVRPTARQGLSGASSP
jgi:hypothetical protein